MLSIGVRTDVIGASRKNITDGKGSLFVEEKFGRVDPELEGEEQFADALVLYFEGAYNHYRTKGPLTQEEIKYLDSYISVCTGN